MSKATGAKKPSESQKAKALWSMKAAKDREKTFWKKKDTIGAVGRAPQRPNSCLGQSVEVLGESLLGLAFGSKLLFATRVAMACSVVGAKLFQNMWVGAYWEGVWLCLDPWDSVRLRTASTFRDVPGKYGPHGELFFLPY